mmetsp:Transcript_58204/g.95572  ORF Transcript_58204/g.95572 Transcript_58204/m.95572 type:complete len:281 (+) Transcript_58204:859-1701(+)
MTLGWGRGSGRGRTGNAQEDVLEGGLGHAVVLNANRRVQPLKAPEYSGHLVEAGVGGAGQMVDDFPKVFLLQHNARERAGQVLVQRRLRVRRDPELQRVARAELGLEVLQGPNATHAPQGHDGDPMGQRIDLLQMVRREDDGAVDGDVRDARPQRAPRHRVEAAGGLIQEHDVWGPNDGDADGQLPFVAPAQGHGGLVGVGREAQVRDDVPHCPHELVLGHAAHAPEEHEVLRHRQVVQQGVELGAVADVVLRLPPLRLDVVPAQQHAPSRRGELPREHA